MIARLLLWIGDRFAPDDLEFSGLKLVSYHISDGFYRLAWRAIPGASAPTRKAGEP